MAHTCNPRRPRLEDENFDSSLVCVVRPSREGGQEEKQPHTEMACVEIHCGLSRQRCYLSAFVGLDTLQARVFAYVFWK